MSKRVKELRKALEEKPHDPRLLQELAWALLEVNDRDGAAEVYGQLAAAYERDGFHLKAVAMLRQAQKLRPRAEFVLRLARLHAQLGLDGEALAYLAKHPPTLESLRLKASLQPDDRDTHLQLAELLLDVGDESGAAAAVARFGVELEQIRERRLVALSRSLDFSRPN